MQLSLFMLKARMSIDDAWGDVAAIVMFSDKRWPNGVHDAFVFKGRVLLAACGV